MRRVEQRAVSIRDLGVVKRELSANHAGVLNLRDVWYGRLIEAAQALARIERRLKVYERKIGEVSAHGP